MEMLSSSETSVLTRSARRNFPEAAILYFNKFRYSRFDIKSEIYARQVAVRAGDWSSNELSAEENEFP
jgi:hypothetical protein